MSSAIVIAILALVQCAVAQDIEPGPQYPQDPGKVLRNGTPQSRGYRCHFENATRTTTCIDSAAAASNGNIRAAPLLVGRPDRLRAPGVNLVADCKSDRAELQAIDGAPYVGELAVSTETKVALARALCAVGNAANDSRLRIS